MIENDTWYRCTVCGREGRVGRCCGDETRVPLNDLAKKEQDSNFVNPLLGEVVKALIDTNELLDELYVSYGASGIIERIELNNEIINKYSEVTGRIKQEDFYESKTGEKVCKNNQKE